MSIILIPLSLVLSVLIFTVILLGVHGKFYYLEITDILILIYSIINLIFPILLLTFIVSSSEEIKIAKRIIFLRGLSLLIIIGTVAISIFWLYQILNNPDISFEVITTWITVGYFLILLYTYKILNSIKLNVRFH